MTGTLTVNTTEPPSGAACHGSYDIDAVIPPGSQRAPLNTTFTADTPTTAGVHPRVGFDYSHGVITHLDTSFSVVCPSGADYEAELYSTAYALDPIPVTRTGSFSVNAAVLDDYGVVIHVSLSGHVHGQRASGVISASGSGYTGNIGDTPVQTCRMNDTWAASRASQAGSSGAAAFFEVVPFRYGSANAWNYYLIATINGCTDATSARVTVAGGPSLTTSCDGQVKLGPLTPKETYSVTVTALRDEHGRDVAVGTSPPLSVYLPGNDGNWIQLD